MARHAINSSTHERYWHNAQLFRHRLVRRGFTELDIDPIFRSVRYSKRRRSLYGHEAPQVDAVTVEAMQPPLRVFLKMPYDVITCTLLLQQRMRAVYMLSDCVQLGNSHLAQRSCYLSWNVCCVVLAACQDTWWQDHALQ